MSHSSHPQDTPAMNGIAPWAALPVVAGDWRDLDLGEACAVLARLSAAEMADGFDPTAWTVAYQRARARRLAAFPNWLLIEAQALLPEGSVGMTCMFYGPGRRLSQVRWNTGLIYDLLSETEANLENDAAAADYLRLFVGLTRGEHGRFSLVESVSDLDLLKPLDPGTAASCDERIRPLRLTPDGNARKVQNIMLYEGGLYENTLVLQANGSVYMGDDEAVAAVPVRHEEIRGPFRIVHDRPWPDSGSTPVNGEG